MKPVFHDLTIFSPLPESDRIDETFDDSVAEDADQKNENDLMCDESVEDMDDLVISDDDIVEDQEQNITKRVEEESKQKDETNAVDLNAENDGKKDELSCEVEVVSHEKKSDEDEAGVVTRRSQRRKTPRQIPTTDNEDDNAAALPANMNDLEGESSETDSKDPAVKNESESRAADELIDENCDEESVTSEMDSLTSGSTLTTR